MGMFLSIVVIRHKNIEMREWLFYVIMAVSVEVPIYFSRGHSI